MRVGNWNLNHGGQHGAKWPEQSELLLRERLDLMVLTEPPPGVSLPGSSSVLSPAGADGWSWVVIVGPGVRSAGLDLPFGRMATAALATFGDLEVVVYGSVLPWRSIASQTHGILQLGESYGESFARLLHEQASDVADLQAAHPHAVVLWAGDFNQALEGTEYVGSKDQRLLLKETLDRLGMTAWNADLARQVHDGQVYAIDLVCGPTALANVAPEEMSGSLDERKLSDHAGYVVTLDL